MALLENTSISKGFDSVFSEFENTLTLNLINSNCLKIFYLDIVNNQFSYDGLHSYLQRNIGKYVFSRASIEKFKLDGDADAIGLKAVELLRQIGNENDNGAGGELGEILLYIFLEQMLNAPKVLSKVELKTSGNQYVFGSDGVHLLTIDNTNFQLVLGESKIKGDLKKAVDEAFKSIDNVANNHQNEVRLIEKNILSESFDAETTSLIQSIIVPTKRDRSVNLDNAFGIFLGYTLDVESKGLSNSEYRSAVMKKIKEDIEKVIPYIENKVNNMGLSGYSFYFYLLPFNDASTDRACIIAKLKGGNS